ncbi:DUF1996 and WSC domain-containing protein [Aspergillus undulatus]|uniref:DUF1996 and WSC domain-containing protein n=1 Tax=Aspergillus undulatus TaxID=1810928 RepID=UPI003CCE076F
MRAGPRLPLLPFLSTLELASAFFKVPCSNPLVVERADPIIQPGIAASHVHTIMGGSGFGFSMDYNDTQAAQCSSCAPVADKSNYWIPTLYYQAENGSFTSVEQDGGALIYYLQREDPNNSTILAPPKDLRMVAGSPMDRKYKNTPESDARSYACLDYTGPAKPETNGFPNYNCPDGLRTQVFFPSCWDGVNFDSEDHKSHMAYPNETYNAGPCPESHPVKIVSIFIEVIWRTEKFAEDWYGDGDSQPFVWSNGDKTGYGLHGDFINGWDVPVLQHALDTCDDPNGIIENCAALELYGDEVTEGCMLEPSIDEQVSGWLDALPGCNPVQPGPDDAKSITTCSAPTAIDRPQHYYTDVTGSLNWAWIGCARDNVDDQRVLSESSSTGDDMTVQKCIQTCRENGYIYAGLEYARECYCGNSIEESKMPKAEPMGKCLSKCSGDESQNCGGYAYIGLYKACGGKECENLQYPGVPQ